jgi:two-component system, response regulator YesN
MYRVIVVDDEEKIREGIVNLFPWESIGFEIVGNFSNGKDALEWLEQNQKVDVVMTDIEMPGMDGITLSSHLTDYRTKVVYFSSYHTFEYAKSAILNRVVDYLVKPIKYDELTKCFERIKHVLDVENIDDLQKQEEEVVISPSYYDSIISCITEYLKESYREATLEDAARKVNLSSSYLSRLFKEKVGLNFSDYLMKLRMEKAKELLGDIRYKQYEIAYRVGYDNPKNFSRAFKTYYGVSPKEFRNHNGMNDEDGKNVL